MEWQFNPTKLMSKPVDQKKEAIALAKLRANQTGQGYYVYLEKRKNKSGTIIELVYHVTRNDLTKPTNSELVGHFAPENSE